MINSYDIDGVIYMGPEYLGVSPEEEDVIITGRSFEEASETSQMLCERGINNKVHYNPKLFSNKTRESSGFHKVTILKKLISEGMPIGIHFEDDPIQAEIIQKNVSGLQVVLLVHNLVEKENVRHL